MSDNSGCSDIPRMMAQKMSKKMSFLGQKHEEKCMNILQWNAGGFLAQK